MAEVARLSRSEPIVALTGYAGTGKTYSSVGLPAALGYQPSDVCWATPTHKACSVLRGKLRAVTGAAHPPVTTLWSFLRKAPELFLHCNACSVDRSKVQHCGCTKCGGYCGGLDVESAQERTPRHKLLILDEASMVTPKDYADLLGRLSEVETLERVVLVGDPGQLPPVHSDRGVPEGWSALRQGLPTVELTEQHRTAADSPIYQTANWLRQVGLDNMIDLLGLPQSNRVRLLETLPLSPKVPQLNERIYLSYTNADRVSLNRTIRRRLGFQNPLEVGDILRSRHNSEVFTKETFAQVESVLNRTDKGATVRLKLDIGEVAEERIAYDGLPQKDPTRSNWLYGFATTAHSAQGGEWDKVVVCYRSRDRHRSVEWDYTAATRARERLYFYRMHG